MTQPKAYSRQFNFTNYSSTFPTLPPPAYEIDLELNTIRTSLNLAIANLGLIQRDDTALANKSVGTDQLSSAVLTLIGSAGFHVKGTWAAATSYAVGDMFSLAGSAYLTMVAHTSSAALTTDITAGKVIGPIYSPLTSTTSVITVAPSGDTTGAADAAAINTALASGSDVCLTSGIFYTNATLTVTTLSQNGQRIYGAGSTSAQGNGAQSTIIRPTSVVTNVFTIDGTSFGGYIQNSGITDMTIDMVNVPDSSLKAAINQVQAYDCYYSNVRVINYGTAKVSWLFSTGAYVTVLTTCQGGLVRFNGASLSNATTTMLFNNCDFTWVDHNNYVNVTFNGGAIQRPYDATVPIIYLAPGTTPYGYVPNTGGLYAAVMSKIDGSLNFSSIGCDWEQGGGYPATYNDGTHGVLTLVRVIQVTANAKNTTFINGDFAGCYLLDAGINTRALGYQSVGIDISTGRDFHFGPIETSANIIGFTDFANYFDFGTTGTYSISASTGLATFQNLSVKPAADADQIFTLKNAAGTFYLDFASNGPALNVYNGLRLAGYSDTGTTLGWQLDTNGLMTLKNAGTTSITLTGSNGTVNVTGGYYFGGTAVVGSRKTGWGAASGTLSRAAYASYTAQTYTGAYVQATAQATENALALLSKTVAALITDLTAHGLIGT